MRAELALRGLERSSLPTAVHLPKTLAQGSPLHTGIYSSALAHALHPCGCVLQTIRPVTKKLQTSRRSVCCCTRVDRALPRPASPVQVIRQVTKMLETSAKGAQPRGEEAQRVLSVFAASLKNPTLVSGGMSEGMPQLVQLPVPGMRWPTVGGQRWAAHSRCAAMGTQQHRNADGG